MMHRQLCAEKGAADQPRQMMPDRGPHESLYFSATRPERRFSERILIPRPWGWCEDRPPGRGMLMSGKVRCRLLAAGDRGIIPTILLGKKV